MNVIKDTLPKGIQLPKPIRYPNLDEMRRMHESGELYIQRKRDGQRHIIHVMEDGVKMFDRNLRQIYHFKSILKAFEGFGLPAGTIIDGEVIIEHKDGSDDFSTISSLNKAGLEKATKLAEKAAPRFMIFDILFAGGESVYNHPYKIRYETMKVFDGVNSVVYVVPNLTCSVDEAKEMAIVNKWEGLVFWGVELVNKLGFGSQAPRLNCWKWKNTKEEDFVCTGYELTSAVEGAPMFGAVGAIKLAENRNGKLVSVGGAGTGLTLKERFEALNWSYPCVVQIAYDERTPTGALRFPRFVRRSEDKSVEEVLADTTSRMVAEGLYAPRGHVK